MGKNKVIKKPVMPKGENILDRGFIPTLGGRMLNPGDKFSDNELAPERLRELKDKGLVRGVMSTEEKGTITK